MGKYHITQSNVITVGSDGGRCLDHFILHRVKENVTQQESREKNVSLQILEAEFIIMMLHHIVSLCESVFFFLIDSATMTIKMLNKDLILELG